MFVPALNSHNEWVLVHPVSTNHEVDLDLYSKGTDADVKVLCPSGPGKFFTLFLHKRILSSRSSFFRTAFQIPARYANGNLNSAGNNEVTIYGASVPDIIIALVFLYAQQYPLYLLNSATPWDCYRIFVVAGFLDVKGLQQVAIRALELSLKKLNLELYNRLPHAAARDGNLHGCTLSDTLRKVFSKAMVDQLQTIVLKATSPLFPGLASLQPALADFALTACHITWIVRYNERSLLVGPQSRSEMHWALVVGGMTWGFAAVKFADPVLTFRVSRYPLPLRR
ncbi:hypothetical protein PG991_000914 [Apiospora marii]|uniref:BTB domain-containing protein n=1 Tax=Apiospora marii TaxID=335849 RepID=A0ABR1STB2_9PEZI